MRIRWTTPAADDLQAIKDYLTEHYPQLAESTVRNLYDAIRSLKSFPNRGRPGLKPGTRELALRPPPYIAVYPVKEHAVEILHIYHGAQDWR
jgi:toxin ParE1/3/4